MLGIGLAGVAYGVYLETQGRGVFLIVVSSLVVLRGIVMLVRRGRPTGSWLEAAYRFSMSPPFIVWGGVVLAAACLGVAALMLAGVIRGGVIAAGLAVVGAFMLLETSWEWRDRLP